ncbi:MAG: carbohydrate ABC transporter permease [Candidatus Hydrogenedentes bacterium]|nr:carbohydrate ABC transporter permease [Candidatus Hydrogenedentota bacterium]
MKGLRIARRALLYAVLAAGGVLMAWPFFWMLGTAFKDLADAMRPAVWPWPRQWRWGNLYAIFETTPFGRYFLNSFFVAGMVTLGVAFTSLTAGYAFARLRFRGRDALFTLVLATMMVPFELTLIPNYVLISRLGWYNTYAALIVPWCANAFSIFLMRQAFLGLPDDFFDAAKVDGCGHLRFLARIAAPLAKPALATVALFAFLGSYNALLWPLIVTAEESMRVVQVGLTYFQGDEGVQMHLLMCATAVVIFPTVALYFAAQRYFVDAALGAGIKG